jgi:putative ABC transport system ATP-binding protein
VGSLHLEMILPHQEKRLLKRFTPAWLVQNMMDAMIQLENVSRYYGDGKGVRALDNVSLKIDRGERVAVMGPSGSGKSTLLNLICGLDESTLGAVNIDGVNIASLDDDARTRLRREKIGMVFQTFNLLPTLTALENISLPLRLQGQSRREADQRANAMIERVGLGGRVTHRPDELSGGERQRIAIARALIFQPPILLADEPTGNLDSKTGEEILGLLDDLHREFNTTILMVTHNEEAAAHCDRILRLRDGKVVKEDRASLSAEAAK